MLGIALTALPDATIILGALDECIDKEGLLVTASGAVLPNGSLAQGSCDQSI
jgi:hypothetical protein